MLLNTFPIVKDKKGNLKILRINQFIIKNKYEYDKIMSGEYKLKMKVKNGEVYIVDIEKPTYFLNDEYLICFEVNNNINESINNNLKIEPIEFSDFEKLYNSFKQNKKINKNKNEKQIIKKESNEIKNIIIKGNARQIFFKVKTN